MDRSSPSRASGGTAGVRRSLYPDNEPFSTGWLSAGAHEIYYEECGQPTGRPAVIEVAYEATSRSGRTVLVGVPPVGEKARLHTLRLHFEQRLIGSHGGGTEPARDIPRYLAMANRGAFDALPMVDHTCALVDVNAAIADLRAGRATKCMIDMRASSSSP